MTFRDILILISDALSFFPKKKPDPTTPPTTPKPPTTPPSTPTNLSAELKEVLDLINSHRQQYNLPALIANAKLNAAAQKHSVWMADSQVMSHTGSGRSSASDRIKAEGYKWQNAAENVAMGYPNATAVVNGWMNSSGHRANILGRYTEIGLGVDVSDRNQKYWTTDFGTPA